MRSVSTANSLALFVRASTTSFSFDINIIYTRRNLEMKRTSDYFRASHKIFVAQTLMFIEMYLQTAVFLPICPTRLAKTALHMRRTPSIPLWTLYYLTALARFSANSNHQYPAVISCHVTVAITVENISWFSIAITITIAKRYNRCCRRSSCRWSRLVIIWYINLFQFTFSFYSFYPLLLYVSVGCLPHVIVFNNIF